MSAILHCIVTSIENDRIIRNIDIWKNKMQTEKKEKEDLLVDKFYDSIITYIHNKLEKIDYLPSQGDYYYSTYLEEEDDEPFIELWIEDHSKGWDKCGSMGCFKSYGGLFNMSDIKEWIRDMIKFIENEKYCKITPISFNFVDNMSNVDIIEMIQEEGEFDGVYCCKNCD
tara:strand:- start:666 stop:1175 length:510 start_codon:yes stop_codon:yes gene_type:complete